MDKQVLQDKLITFCDLLREEQAERFKDAGYSISASQFGFDIGYKYARVYEDTGNQKLAQFMVDVRTGDIYGVKSWTQVNSRRWYGTLDSITEWSWRFGPGATPRAGSESERLLFEREKEIKANYKKRGRKPKGTV